MHSFQLLISNTLTWLAHHLTCCSSCQIEPWSSYFQVSPMHPGCLPEVGNVHLLNLVTLQTHDHSNGLTSSFIKLVAAPSPPFKFRVPQTIVAMRTSFKKNVLNFSVIGIFGAHPCISHDHSPRCLPGP